MILRYDRGMNTPHTTVKIIENAHLDDARPGDHITWEHTTTMQDVILTARREGTAHHRDGDGDWRTKEGRLITEGEGITITIRRPPECECPEAPEHLWTTHYGAVDPGSMIEHNPECPVHRVDPQDSRLPDLDAATPENLARLRDTPVGRALMAEALEEEAYVMDVVISNGDAAEVAAHAPGESGRGSAVGARDALYENPAQYLRNRARTYRTETPNDRT